MWPKTLIEIAHGLGAPLNTLSAPSASVCALSTDSRRVGHGELFIAIKGDTHDGHAFVAAALKQGAVAAVVESSWLSNNPTFQSQCIAVQDTTAALRNLAKFFRQEFNFPVFAIGGSNGKTTTKEMLACLLSALERPVTRTHKSENGFLGLAITLTQQAHQKSSPVAALVAEIGIDDVGAMSQHLEIAKPNYALLTALGPEHLAGLGSWDKAVEEELILFRNAPPTCKRIWQAAEKRLRDVMDEIRAEDVLVCEASLLNCLPEKAIEFSRTRKISLLKFEIAESSAAQSNLIFHWIPGSHEPNQQSWKAHFIIPLPGLHNAQNFALALGLSLIHI